MVSNMHLVRTRKRIIKSRTMRQCTPAFEVEPLAEACGTPWDHNQEQLIGKAKQPTTRLPPSSGIDAIAEGPPRPAPRWPGGGDDGHSPSDPGQGPGPDEAGSDPTSTENAGSDDEEDPGEGQMGSTSSRGRGNVRKRSELSSTSEELIAKEEPPSPSKRQLEGQAEESEAVRPRIDEGTGEVEERPEKFQATRAKVRSVKEIEKFLDVRNQSTISKKKLS